MRGRRKDVTKSNLRGFAFSVPVVFLQWISEIIKDT